MRTYHTLLLIGSLMIQPRLHAQSEERFLPVIVQVEMNGERASEFTVTIFNDNEQVGRLEPSSLDACQLTLDLNAYFSIRISKPGFHDKLLSIDTHLPEDVEAYKDYLCVVSLERADTADGVDPFYLDFPNALVRWDPDTQSFDHSAHYLEAIRAKRTPSIEQTAKD